MATFLTITDLSKRLQLSPASIRRRVDDGTLPGPIKIGAAARWLASDIEAWERGLAKAREPAVA